MSKALQLGTVYSKLGSLATTTGNSNSEQYYWLSTKQLDIAKATNSFDYAFALLNLVPINESSVYWTNSVGTNFVTIS